MKEYREFQFAWIISSLMFLVLLFVIALYMTSAGDRPISGVGLFIFIGSSALVFALFYGMTTTIDAEKIVVSFGIGLIQKRIGIDKIKTVTIIKNPWYYGWGIRYIPNGKLYNMSGLKGVELTFYSTDRIVRIGTQDPAQLKTEIEKFLKQ